MKHRFKNLAVGSVVAKLVLLSFSVAEKSFLVKTTDSNAVSVAVINQLNVVITQNLYLYQQMCCTEMYISLLQPVHTLHAYHNTTNMNYKTHHMQFHSSTLLFIVQNLFNLRMLTETGLFAGKFYKQSFVCVHTAK